MAECGGWRYAKPSTRNTKSPGWMRPLRAAAPPARTSDTWHVRSLPGSGGSSTSPTPHGSAAPRPASPPAAPRAAPRPPASRPLLASPFRPPSRTACPSSPLGLPRRSPFQGAVLRAPRQRRSGGARAHPRAAHPRAAGAGRALVIAAERISRIVVAVTRAAQDRVQNRTAALLVLRLRRAAPGAGPRCVASAARGRRGLRSYIPLRRRPARVRLNRPHPAARTTPAQGQRCAPGHPIGQAGTPPPASAGAGSAAGVRTTRRVLRCWRRAAARSARPPPPQSLRPQTCRRPSTREPRRPRRPRGPSLRRQPRSRRRGARPRLRKHQGQPRAGCASAGGCTPLCVGGSALAHRLSGATPPTPPSRTKRRAQRLIVPPYCSPGEAVQTLIRLSSTERRIPADATSRARTHQKSPCSRTLMAHRGTDAERLASSATITALPWAVPTLFSMLKRNRATGVGWILGPRERHAVPVLRRTNTIWHGRKAFTHKGSVSRSAVPAAGHIPPLTSSITPWASRDAA
jgi:hypothetical protein